MTFLTSKTTVAVGSLVIMVAAYVSADPVMSVNPPFIVGQTKTIACYVNSPEKASSFPLHWSVGKETLNSSFEQTVDVNGILSYTSYYQLKVKASDNMDVYKCTAVLPSGTTYATLTVRVVQSPVITYTENPVDGALGSNVKLSCNIQATPEVTTVVWYRVDNSNWTSSQISAENNPTKYAGGTVHNPALTIKHLASSDIGFYRCEAVNSVGRGVGGLLIVDFH